jgi:lipopolysaccharide export system protein LptC
MQKIRMAHRWRVMLTIAVGVFFSFGSFWLVQVMERSALDMRPDPNRNLPDYIVDRFSFVRLGIDGQPAYIVSGDKLTHFPIDDSALVEQPYMRNLSDTQPPTETRARQARIDQDNTRVRLTGDVHVERAASGPLQSMDLKTEALTVFPESDRMETDQPVRIVRGQSVMTGVGMKANNATRQTEVSQRLQITYPPAPR